MVGNDSYINIMDEGKRYSIFPILNCIEQLYYVQYMDGGSGWLTWLQPYQTSGGVGLSCDSNRLIRYIHNVA